ncbi:hypothetical protein ACX93W_16920 [Paenibacillus sp. CAU 1782]
MSLRRAKSEHMPMGEGIYLGLEAEEEMTSQQQYGDSSSLMEKTQAERNRKGLTGDITPQGKDRQPKTPNKPST